MKSIALIAIAVGVLFAAGSAAAQAANGDDLRQITRKS